jgi:hypothetical protein
MKSSIGTSICRLSVPSLEQFLETSALLSSQNVTSANPASVNSIDNSVNIITKSTAEFFNALRERIETGVPEEEKRKKIMDAVLALEQSHGKPSFAQRYTDLIAIAADHMTLLAPFIPALSEMLHQVLK